MKLRLLIVSLMAVAAPAIGHAQSDSTTRAREVSAVRAVVERYLHGLKFNDTVSLHQSFWPEARLFAIRPNGQINELTQAKWYAMFEKSAGKEEKGDLRIASVDITGNAAAVKVVEDYPDSRYTDYLNLLRINDRWWIVNKIYTMERITR
ncbi:MAG TPA: nuclear transport factor 2 family protein [Gemmatimonadaceae bacterium]|nr:nuclear transport factor 2 family protein [Gemmatimonadaceae bacterium]